MRYLVVVISVCWICTAGSVRIEDIPAGGNPTDADYLQYDDGSPCWLILDGAYRGVWFHVEDFIPYMNSLVLESTEYWMYHDVSYPWDISAFNAEVWEGGPSGPVVFRNVKELNAIHYAPVFAYFPCIWPYHWPPADFWIIENTEMSTGGWPSLIGDGTPPAVDHSFYSDDFSVWVPWSDGTYKGDFLIRCTGECPIGNLNPASWGSIKTLFR